MSTTDDDNDHQRGGGNEEITSSKKECTLCEQNNVDDITEGIDRMAIQDMSTCAACGKEGNSDDMNTCNKCKSVKYCNAACKKKHRSKHKKACERRVAELYDEQLFKEVEPEECPICLLPLPHRADRTTVKSCCGKRICDGCVYAMRMSEGKDLCAFCRTPLPATDEENMERIKKIVDKGNAEAFSALAGLYADGVRGIPQDHQKAIELYLKAGELGCATAYFNLGQAYNEGRRGLEVDDKKAKYYWELAAMGGNLMARHNLGAAEADADNVGRAMKHFILAARAGYEASLDIVKMGFTDGFVTKGEYANTLRAFQKRQNEMKSDERDKAVIYYATR